MSCKITSRAFDMLALVLVGDLTVANFRFLTITSELVAMLNTDISVRLLLPVTALKTPYQRLRRRRWRPAPYAATQHITSAFSLYGDEDTTHTPPASRTSHQPAPPPLFHPLSHWSPTRVRVSRPPTCKLLPQRRRWLSTKIFQKIFIYSSLPPHLYRANNITFQPIDSTSSGFWRFAILDGLTISNFRLLDEQSTFRDCFIIQY